ncbi:MAG: polymorphic toxin-type HINT domain-containing protein [Nannocystales bacterium]
MTTRKLGRSAVAALCSLTLVSASCGGSGGGGAQDLEIEGGTELRTVVGDWLPELVQLRYDVPDFDDSAAVGALPARSWVDDGGGAHYAIPLDVAPGPAGYAPSLSLSYSSQGGNGTFGVGFSVAGTAMVTRCQRNLAKDAYYEALTLGVEDPICYGGERLVLWQGTYGAPGSTYRLESDPSKRFSYKGHLDEPQEGVQWWMTTAGGEVYTFRGMGGALDRWPLVERSDEAGNRISYAWSVLPDNEVVLSEIRYGGTGTPDSTRKVIFNYQDEDRSDAREGYVRGDLYRRTQLANEVRVEAPHGELLTRYELEYELHPHSLQSILKSVTKFDAQGVALPATEFDWTVADAPPLAEGAIGAVDSDVVHPSFTPSKLRRSQRLLVGDFEGDQNDEVLAYHPDDEDEHDASFKLHGVVSGHAVDVFFPTSTMPEAWEPPTPPYPYLCGNGVLDPGESCDGQTLSPSCLDLNSSGTAMCSDSCQFDYSLCASCESSSAAHCEPPAPPVFEPITLTNLHRVRPPLGLMNINYAHNDRRSNLLMPHANGEGVDEWGIPWADRLAVFEMYNDPSDAWQQGTSVIFSALGGNPTAAPVYSVVPLEFNGDGRDDLFLCQGYGYKTSRWHLALSKDVVESGELGWDFYDTGVGCSTHDETTILPHPRGTEVLAVIQRFPTSLQDYPVGFDDPEDYWASVLPIAEEDRGGYRVLDFDPATGVGALSEEVLPRDLYQRWSDLNCNNGYIAAGLGEPSLGVGAPLLGAGLSRDLQIDLHGDGHRDVVRFEVEGGDDFSNFAAIHFENYDTGAGFTYEPSCVDGYQEGILRVYRNTGEGYVAAEEPAFVFPGLAHENLFLNWYGAQTVDWNGDGLTDILLPSDGVPDDPDAPTQDEDWTVLLSNGDGEFTPLDVQNGVAWPHYIEGAGTAANADTFENTRVLSLRSGSRVKQLFVRSGQPTQDWSSAQRGKGALLERATDGQGLEHSFSMVRTGSGYVVRSRAVNTPGTGVPYDLPSNTRTWSYEYSDPVRDRYGMRDIGFAWVRETFLGERNGFPWSRSTQLRTYDRTYDAGLRDYPRSRQPTRVETAWVSDDGDPEEEWHIQCSRVDEWKVEVQALPGGDIWQAYPAYTESFSAALPASEYNRLSPGHESGPGPDGQCDDISEWSYLTHSTAEVERDDFGNVEFSRTAVLRGVSEETATETVYSDFDYDVGNWIVAAPQSVVTTSYVGPTDQKTREVAIEYQPASNMVASVTREPATPEEQTTTFGYESHGNVNLTVVSTPTQGSRSMSMVWDAEGVVPISQTNDLGQVTNLVFHSGTGLPVATVDANGLTQKATYDGFFRPTGSSFHSSPLGPSDGADASVEYQASLVDGAVLDVVAGAQGQETRTSYDRAGRVVRELWHGVASVAADVEFPVSPALEGPEVCRWYEYSFHGQVLRTSEATASCGSPPTSTEAWSRNEFDNGGRLLSTHWYDDEAGLEVESSVEHLDIQWVGDISGEVPTPQGAAVVMRDPENHPTTRVVDALGRVSASVDALGVMTCFDYGPFGEVDAVHRNCGVNPQGPVEVSTYGYDSLSRLVTSTEPANGTQILSYTEFDELDIALDPKGQILDHDYDSLGRMTFQHSTVDGTSSWTYDDGLVGALVEQESADGVRQTFEYDEFGRPEKTRHYMPSLESPGMWEVDSSTAWLFSYNYDGLGRLSDIVYPTTNAKVGNDLPGEVSPVQKTFAATFQYDGSNNLRSIAGAGRILWALDDANEAGLPLIERFNDGITGSASQSKSTRYQPLTNRVLEIGVEAANAPVQNFVYEWTPSGDLHRREEGTTGQSETFGYDALHRLTGQDGGTAATYDALGNITSRPGVGNYEYDADTGHLSWYGWSGNTVPHDANGNVEQLGNVGITWSALDKVRTLSSGGQTSSFVYDATGARSLRHGEDGYTMTIGGLFELSDQPGAKLNSRDTKARYFVPVGGSVVEVRDQLLSSPDTPGKWKREVFYQYNDHLGSGSLLVNEDGDVEEAVSYGPWGEARAWEDWTLDATPEELQNLASGFTGHQPELDMGLINMRGRMYSPVLARFLSVDPVIESAADAQTWNAYSYVSNNPLRYVDPSGLCREATDWSEPKDNGHGTINRWRTDGSDCDRGSVPQEVPPQDTGPSGGSTGTGDTGGGGGRSGAGGNSESPNGAGQGGPSYEELRYIDNTWPIVAVHDAVWRVGEENRRRREPGAWDSVTAKLGGYVDWMVGESTGGGLSVVGSPWVLLGLLGFADKQSSTFETAETVGVGMSLAVGAGEFSYGAWRFGANYFGRQAIRTLRPACFAGGTLVHTEEGLIPIEDVKVGDLVWTRDEQTGRSSLRPVKRVFVTSDRKLLELTLEGDGDIRERIRTTAEHPFWTRGGGWVAAAQLGLGDEVLQRSGGWLRVGAATWEQERAVVYNLEVDEFHTYFVGKHGAWVHNECIQIALGLDIPGAGMKALAQQTGASWWRFWESAGVTRRVVQRNFGRAFHQAVKRADRIHFSLDGIANPAAAARAGASGFTIGNMTNAELRYIASNPDILAKTVFYRGGKIVPSPF